MENAEERTGLRGRQRTVVPWKRRLLVLSLALGLQAGILGLAVIIGVMDPPIPKEATLRLPEGSPTVAREQRQTLNKQMAAIERMQREGQRQMEKALLESSQPPVPMAALDIQASFTAMGAMLPSGSLAQAGVHTHMAGLDADPLPAPEPVAFLGEQLRARSIVLLLDVSGSVKSKMERAGLSMTALREEVHGFIEQLGPNHLFGIIQFTRKWDCFRPELVPATKAIREEAATWINRSFRTSGTSGSGWTGGQPNGIEAVLSTAFGMDAAIDEIFIVSDGDFQRTPPGGGGQDVPWPELRELSRRLQEQSIGETRLRMLCFYPPDSARAELQAWLRENGDGQLRVIEGSTKPNRAD